MSTRDPKNFWAMLNEWSETTKIDWTEILNLSVNLI